jgi:hypothetical protein
MKLSHAGHIPWLVKSVSVSHVDIQSDPITPKIIPSPQSNDLHNITDTSTHRHTKTPTHQDAVQDEALQHLRFIRCDSESLTQEPRTQTRRARKSLRTMLGSLSQPASGREERVQRDRMHVLQIQDERVRLPKSRTKGDKGPVSRSQLQASQSTIREWKTDQVV